MLARTPEDSECQEEYTPMEYIGPEGDKFKGQGGKTTTVRGVHPGVCGRKRREMATSVGDVQPGGWQKKGGMSTPVVREVELQEAEAG